MLRYFWLALLSFSTLATEDAWVPPQKQWSFSGPFGTFDRASAQRGFQVYKEVCSACHGVALVKYRNLADLGFSVAEIKALAAEREFKDELGEEGQVLSRPGLPSDPLSSPFANEQEARYANNGVVPPDLSLMIKARAHGADYMFALLTGFSHGSPPGVTLGEGQYYNPYFPGGLIGMAPPLTEGLVTYSDGSKPTIQQMADDVTTFLAWAAEPEMEARKKIGWKMLIMLSVLAVMLYILKKAIWRRIK